MDTKNSHPFTEEERREFDEIVKPTIQPSKFEDTEQTLKVRNWFTSRHKKLIDVIDEFIANYTVDLCENSQEFKRDLQTFLTKIKEEL